MNTDVTLENYDRKREELLNANSNLVGVVLRDGERQLDAHLKKLKEEFSTLFGDEDKYDLPVLTDSRFSESSLYKFLSRMPKGADLHVHDMALLPASELIDLLCECPEFCINADRKSYDLAIKEPLSPAPDGYMRFFEAVNSGYYTRNELCFNWTVASADKAGCGVWEYFETLFSRHDVLSCNSDFALKYYDRAFRYYCKKNIMHIEIHNMLTDDCVDDSAEYIRAIREAYYNVKKDYPFFTVRIIGAGVKADSETIDFTKKCFLNASYAQEVVKDESDPENPENFVIGFDLVNEEDKSLPLSAFAPMLLKVKKQYPDMKLYIHGGESLSATNENLIDAYLLGASRVGHGLNLYRYPDLHSRYVKAEICLEVCPVSNQKLGYTKDIRNHPATEYLKSGMAIALCSDDPAYMERETLTDDFFAATVCWDLDLADLKQLGINSIMYSGLCEREKFAALREYNRMWNEFVDKMLDLSDDA